jgi:hypothetical protein
VIVVFARRDGENDGEKTAAQTGRRFAPDETPSKLGVLMETAVIALP